MIKTERKWDNKIYYYLAIAIALLALIYAVWEKIGAQDLGSFKQGRIIISGIDSDTKVFVDGAKALLSGGSNGTLVKAEPGRRAVIVSKDGYWPWMKYVNVEPGLVSEIRPFLIQMEPKIEIVPEADPEFERLMKLISSSEPVSVPSTLFSTDRTTSIWVTNGTIFARWESLAVSPPTFCFEKCSPEISVFHTDLQIKNIAFYGERNDVVIVSLDKFIYGVEVDRREVQNFEPIYEGVDPKFYESPDGKLYVLDNGKIVRLIL